MNDDSIRPVRAEFTPEGRTRQSPHHAPARYLGINLGAETIKLVEVVRDEGVLRWSRREIVEHHKQAVPRLQEVLRSWQWEGLSGAAVSGRLGRQLALPQVPGKQAQARGYRHLYGNEPATVVSLGSHGFSVLELRAEGIEVWRENSRCSQGTGNFLRQLVERFSLTIEEASRLCTNVVRPAVLSGRCPVILKTDMTHLANKGGDRAEILAGLFDAVCENVLVLIKPGLCPHRIVLIGGVARAPRVQATFGRRLSEMGLELEGLEGDDGLYFEALGSALVAAEQAVVPPPLDQLWAAPTPARLSTVPGLAEWKDKVHRLPAPPPVHLNGTARDVLLGFDIGSTGSKAVAIDAGIRATIWEGYRATAGDPVGAAQALLREFAAGPAGSCPVLACGVTGSGRDIVGSLLTACYGKEVVFVLNEIAAHAEGARFFDPRVDTIFEIGGQDAKYIRLAEGRIVDCAMNEACSAGTGSFIEEQGRKFAGIRDVRQLGREALAATQGVSLGQHCSVFMAEVIDEAVAAGVRQPAIIAGLYDSIIQNYLNRVKGSRSVGQVIFCQGMPFASDALAAAVARQTGSEVIVPPNPGTVGALGIALLAAHEVAWAGRTGLDPARFLEARVEAKDSFRCHSTVGCGGAGNRCRIERLKTVVASRNLAFTWGGGCALHDKGTRQRKLPNLAPDCFREREEAARALLAPLLTLRGGRRVALTDEFTLKGLMPFFATYLHELGCDLVVIGDGSQADLKRGIQGANVPFCAPMQLHHGIVARLAETGAESIFLPMLRSLPRSAGEKNAVTCPILQASPDLMRWDLGAASGRRVLSPVINLGTGSLTSEEFLDSCRRIAADLGIGDERFWRSAHATAVRAQTDFDRRSQEIGARALQYCEAHGIVPVVVLGRPYTIYNTVLNSNVPAILREQGAIGIPVDCYPLAEETPVFGDMYWGQGQRILRAAHQVRRTPGQTSLYCSNYACGPDSFNLHFYAHIMEGRPFAVIETDGHSGDAGTKTRVEAFLHCVEQERRARQVAPAAITGPAPIAKKAPSDFSQVQAQSMTLAEILRRRERLLIPWMGPGAEVLAACFQGLGIAAESLPPPGDDELRRGRRQTSGKECLPMALTLGGLLRRIEMAAPTEQFAYLAPRTCGPCRFGVYNLLSKIVLDRQGLANRVRIWAPCDEGYFRGMPAGFAMLVLAGFMAADLLLEMYHEVAPAESAPGEATRLYRRLSAELLALLVARAPDTRSLPGSLWQVGNGELFGLRELLVRAAAGFRALRGAEDDRPTVLVVGEIYVRCVPFANDFVLEKLRQRGLRAHLAPFHEWLDYSEHISRRGRSWRDFAGNLSGHLQHCIIAAACAPVDQGMGWPARLGPADLLAASAPFLRDDLRGEAVLTLGTPLAAWRRGRIQGVVSVGPHECMPNKIAESQFFHVTETTGLPTLTLGLNGEPLDGELLDSFVFAVRERARVKQVKGSSDRHSHGLVANRPTATATLQ